MATQLTYAEYASSALKALRPLESMGYQLEAAGECIRITHNSSMRYVSLMGLVSTKNPCQYAIATFADRW